MKKENLKFLKNPLWIIIILLIVIIFQIRELNSNIESQRSYLRNIENDLGWTREALGTPSEGMFGYKKGINEKLDEILDRLKMLR